jgi:cellobiose-specific phosphotransferase system component IIA
MMQLVMYSGGRQIIRKLGGQIMNVVASAGEATATATKAAASAKTAPRRRMA